MINKQYIISFLFSLLLSTFLAKVQAQFRADCYVNKQITCAGANDGEVACFPHSGTAPYTCFWNDPNSQSGTVCYNLGPGTYNMICHDATGATVTCWPTAVTLTSTPTINATIGSNPEICNQTNGSASVTGVSGGSGSGYSYNWFPSGGTGASTPNNLNSGNYTCTITDGASCTRNFTTTVGTGGPAVNASNTTSTPVSCFGGNNGTAHVTPTGGSGWSYSWYPGGQVTQTANGLTSQNYTVTVTNSAGCTDKGTVFVGEPTSLAGTSNANSEICGNGKGTATVNPSGGTPNYTYAWSPSGGAGQSASNLSQGNYNCLVTDSKGCTKNFPVTINNVNMNLTVTIPSHQDVDCFGANTGSATAQVTGGTPPNYSYAWSPSGGNAQTANGLTAGPYTILATDVNGCTGSTSVNILQPISALNANAQQTAPANCGTSTGSADANASGGTPPYTYQWSPSGGNNATANGLAAGPYSVLVTDNKGCTHISNVTINSTGNLSAAVNVVSNVSCFGGNNGAATVSASSTNPPYTYAWSPSGGNSSAASNLVAGNNYAVQVTDNAGCVATKTFVITQPTAITGSVTANPIPCGSTNGSAFISANGGSPGYSYTWSSVPVQTTANATGLTAGTYSVTVKDTKSCTKVFTTLISNTGGPTVNLASNTSVTCFGGNNGAASFTATGANPPFTYAWSPSGGNSSAASNLTVGNYMITVTNTASCITTATVNIAGPAQMNANVVNNNVSYCIGSSTTISANPSGGTPGYNYNWSNATGLSCTSCQTPAVNPSVNTVYTVTVIDSKSCTTSGTVSVTVHPSPVINGGSDKTICGGGSVTLTATGGATYVWTPSTGLSNPNISNPVATPTTQMSYIVTGTDASGCSKSDTVNVNFGSAPVISASSANSTVCQGFGSTTLSASGGNTYAWSPGGQTGASISVSPDQLGTNTYTVTGANASGCTATSTVSITVTPGPAAPAVAPSSASYCLGDSILKFTATPGPPNTIGWTDPFNSFFVIGNTYQPPQSLIPGTYTVLCVQGTSSWCISNPTTVSLKINPLPIANAGANMTICPGFTAHLNASGGTNYMWSPPASLNNASVSNPSANPSSTITYLVIVTDANNCSSNDSVRVSVVMNTDCGIEIYNMISPNGDGINDVWWIDGITSFKDNSVRIYNRWGAQVWEAANYDNDKVAWTGQNQKGEKLPEGTYFYVIEFKGKTFSGFVEVVR